MKLEVIGRYKPARIRELGVYAGLLCLPLTAACSGDGPIVISKSPDAPYTKPECTGMQPQILGPDSFKIVPDLSTPFKNPDHVVSYLSTVSLEEPSPSASPTQFDNSTPPMPQQPGVGYTVTLNSLPTGDIQLRMYDFGDETPYQAPGGLIPANTPETVCPVKQLTDLEPPLMPEPITSLSSS